MYNNFQQQPMMVGYAQQPPKQAKFSVVLTNEELNSLKNNGKNFDLGLSDDELRRGCCVHKDANGDLKLVEGSNGLHSCTICGKQFRLVQDLTTDSVATAVNNITDILETIKTFYVTVPVQAARDFYPITGLINKIPKLYELAMDSFGRYESTLTQQVNGNPYGFNLANRIFGGNMFGGVQPQQQMYQQPIMMAPQQQMVPQPVQQQVYQAVDQFGNTVLTDQFGNLVQGQSQFNPMLQQQPVYQQPVAQPVYQQPQAQPQPVAQAPVAPQNVAQDVKTTTVMNV